MRVFPRPRIVVSKCVEHESVRWNGQIIRNEFVNNLKNFVDFIPVCPEVGVGLGVPRATLRLVQVNDDIRLMQPDTGTDFTDKMKNFGEKFLSSLPKVDGFIMMGRSPSSGLKGVKLYPSMGKVASIGKTSGIFGGMVLKRFSHLPLEEEGRLKNSRIREHFLRRVYTISSFREVQKSKKIRDLIDFHTENKLLLKTYNQHRMRILGLLVANKNQEPIEDVIGEYEKNLYMALKKAPRCNSYIYTLENSMGYFKNELSGAEKQFFLRFLKQYLDGKVPLIVPVDILRSWIVRFEEEYLARQTFFEPYPEGLMDIDSITEACGTRDYWNEED